MPLIKSGSKEAISNNIREMIRAGHPRKQAVAAALDTARRAGRKFAEGGNAERSLRGARPSRFSYDATLPELSQNIEDRRKEPYSISAAISHGLNPDGITWSELKEMFQNPFTRFQDMPSQVNERLLRIRDADEMSQTQLAKDMGISDMIPKHIAGPRAAGGRAYAAGGYTQGSPWEERAAARSIQHAGMIHSNVPGRTDKLPITVGGGAFVVPADHLAALGQGNSQAGAAILNGMFGLGGGKKGTVVKGMRPTIPKMKMKKMAEGGESQPTDIIAAGGEYVISPEKVREIGGGDLDRGHSILHKWVLQTRKKHIKTLKGLKEPKT